MQMRLRIGGYGAWGQRRSEGAIIGAKWVEGTLPQRIYGIPEQNEYVGIQNEMDNLKKVAYIPDKMTVGHQVEAGTAPSSSKVSSVCPQAEKGIPGMAPS